jgi:hypothetical protein
VAVAMVTVCLAIRQTMKGYYWALGWWSIRGLTC